jgi:hypothetical protein
VKLTEPQFNTPELFRVTASIPQVWKLAFGIFVKNPLNFAIAPEIVINVGVGSSQVETVFPFPVNTFNTMELPALTLVGRIRAVILADDHWNAHGYIAPFFPMGEFT